MDVITFGNFCFPLPYDFRLLFLTNYYTVFTCHLSLVLAFGFCKFKINCDNFPVSRLCTLIVEF